MTDKRTPLSTKFVDGLWAMDEKVLIQAYIVNRTGRDSEAARAVIQAKSMLAAEDDAASNRSLAKQTRWLAWATVLMAGATLAMAVAAFMSLGG